MQPLYIDGKTACRVVLDEPALRITVPEQADRLFPLTRISRIVCFGNVEWTTSALMACADTGIHILFLKKNGEIRARWLGRSGERQLLMQRLIDLLSRTDGPALYANWHASMEKLAARSFARRIGLDDWREHPVAKLRYQLEESLGDSFRYHEKLMQSILYSELLVWLSACGMERNNEVLLSSRLDIVEDLSELLLWDFYGALMKTGKIQNGENPLQFMAGLFQQRHERCYSLFRSCINKLHQFLLEVS